MGKIPLLPGGPIGYGNGSFASSAAPPWVAVYPGRLLRRPFMGRKLYVGNLAYGVGDGDLQQLFEAFGTVQSAQVIMDRDTGRSKGFGFVEMGSDQEAQAAITGLNGKDSGGRTLTVNEA